MTAASLKKLPCHVDFPHISLIALFFILSVFLGGFVLSDLVCIMLCKFKAHGGAVLRTVWLRNFREGVNFM